jgi:hypothetical protein
MYDDLILRKAYIELMPVLVEFEMQLALAKRVTKVHPRTPLGQSQTYACVCT